MHVVKDIVVRRRNPSRSTGTDGIPDYVCAIKGDPRAWAPPLGHRLEVRCGGNLLRYVIEADRANGWAITKKMIEGPDGVTEVKGKEIFCQGVITYAVVADTARWLN